MTDKNSIGEKCGLENSKTDGSYFRAIIENIESIFDILRIRAKELVYRFGEGDAWETFDIQGLSQNFTNVFMAIEKNSRGRYRFVDNLAAQDESSYYDHLNISSVNTKTVTMPSVFQDVLRDLLANARKYTPPGGRISGGLFDSGEELRFVVEDNGMGIAEDEILKVIGYGARASNAQGKKTLGGGYGLTKAYYYTKAYGGRFWVDSQLGQGTRIEIRIPKSA